MKTPRRKGMAMSLVFCMLAALTVAGGAGSGAAQEPGALRAGVDRGVCRDWRCCFLQLDAQFAGFAQILVYIGAVAILVVFAILLTRGRKLPKEGVFSRTWFAGLVIAAAVFAVLAWAVMRSRPGFPQEARCACGDGTRDRQWR